MERKKFIQIQRLFLALSIYSFVIEMGKLYDPTKVIVQHVEK